MAKRPLLTVVTMRLFTSDVEKLRALAADGVTMTWQDKARRLLHDAVEQLGKPSSEVR